MLIVAIIWFVLIPLGVIYMIKNPSKIFTPEDYKKYHGKYPDPNDVYWF